MSKCLFIVILKKKPNKQTLPRPKPPQSKYPQSVNCCKQTQMQDQCFSVAVVADDSHPQHCPQGEAEREQAPGQGRATWGCRPGWLGLRQIWPVWRDLGGQKLLFRLLNH